MFYGRIKENIIDFFDLESLKNVLEEKWKKIIEKHPNFRIFKTTIKRL